MNRFLQHPVTLEFLDPAVEEAFWQRFASGLWRYFQVGAVLLAVAFAAFGPVDAWLVPDHFAWVCAIRYGLVVPGLTAIAALLFVPRLRPLVERRIQEVIGLAAAFGLGGLLVIGRVLVSAAPTEATMVTSAMGISVALTFLYGMSRLRFFYAAIAGTLGTAGPLLLMFTMPEPSAGFMVLAVFFGTVTNIAGMWIAYTLESFARRDFVRERELIEARARSQALLENALPSSIATRMRAMDGRPSFAERHDEVTVLLADVVGFTPLSERLPLAELADLLDKLFSKFDALCAEHGVEKIKTLGDGWLACAGVPSSRRDHADVTASLALDMLAAMSEIREQHGVSLRIGVCTGPVVAGVIGRTRYAYDLWGEALSGATRLEHTGAAGRVRISEATAARLSSRFRVERTADAVWLLGTD